MIDTEPLSRFFRHTFGADPAGFWAGPGRVNLIGEHTDAPGWRIRRCRPPTPRVTGRPSCSSPG